MGEVNKYRINRVYNNSTKVWDYYLFWGGETIKSAENYLAMNNQRMWYINTTVLAKYDTARKVFIESVGSFGTIKVDPLFNEVAIEAGNPFSAIDEFKDYVEEVSEWYL